MPRCSSHRSLVACPCYAKLPLSLPRVRSHAARVWQPDLASTLSARAFSLLSLQARKPAMVKAMAREEKERLEEKEKEKKQGTA